MKTNWNRKTIKQWFEGFPDVEIRNKLLYNWEHHGFVSNNTHYGERHEYSMFRTALYRGFKWNNTPEGYSFWSILWRKALKNPLDEYPVVKTITATSLAETGWLGGWQKGGKANE